MNASTNKENINKAANDNTLETLKKEFLNSFVSFENDRGIVDIINDLSSSKDISPNLKKRLEIWLKTNEERFPWVTLESIKKKDIEARLWKQIIELHSLRSQVTSQIQSLYDIDDAQLENEIMPAVWSQTKTNLQYILKSKQNTRKFVSQINTYKSNPSSLPATKDVSNVLESFWLKEKAKSMNINEQAIVFKLLKSLRELPPESDRTEEIEDLLKIVPLDIDEKKELITSYLPYTNAQTLLNHWIISKTRADEIKIDFISAATKGESIEKSVIEKVAPSVNYEDVIVKTSNLSKKEIEKLVKSESFIGALKSELTANAERIQEMVKEKNEKDLSSFREKLKSTWKVEGAHKFESGAIILTHTSRWVSFAEIQQDSSITGQITFIDKGTNYYVSSNTEISEWFSQEDFLDSFKWEKSDITKMVVITKDELNSRIKSGNIKEETEQNLKSKGEIDTLYQERREKLLSEWKSEEEIEHDNDIQSILHHNENTIWMFLDELDPAGKDYGFQKWVVLKERWADNSYWVIAWIDKQEVILEDINGKWQTVVPFSIFKNGCEQLKIERVGWLNWEADFFHTIERNSNISKSWQGIKVKDGQFVMTDKNYDDHGHEHVEEKEIKYFVSQDGEEFIKVNKIKGDRIEVQFGTVKDEKTGEKGKDGKDIKQTNYKLEKKIYTVTYGFLEHWIRKNKLEPKHLDGTDGVPKNLPIWHDHRQWSLLNWWAKWFSFANIGQALHDIEHSIEHYFEWGQKEQAAKFAMKAFSLLPCNYIDTLAEIQASLMSDVEWEQKKRQDKSIEHLKQVDSKDAVKEIVHWLHYSNTPSYKIHAGMMYMIQSYGVLCAKWALIDMKGEFIWYKALGGKPNDAFFKEVQKNCETWESGKGVPFSEEELVYQWLKKLADKGLARSRLHKEFKSARAEWKNKEYDTGLKDGGDERGIEGRVEFTMGELRNGNYPNAFWWLQKVFEKWGSSELVQKVPFIIAFSWICYDVDGKWSLDKMKNFPANWWLSPILRFLSYPSQMDEINATILEVAQRIGELENDPSIYKEAYEIYKNRKKYTSPNKDDPSADWSYKQKIKKTEDFYKKHGKKIISALNLANAWDNVDSRYSWLIKIEKDDGVHLDGKQREWNKIFKKYYEDLHWFISEFKFEADSLFDDLQRGNWLSWLDLYRIGTKRLFFSTGWKLRFDDESTFMIIDEIKEELKAISTRDYTGKWKDSPENKIIQKKIAKDIVREIYRFTQHNHWSDTRVLWPIGGPTSIMWFLSKYDINFLDIVDYKLDWDSILHGTNPDFEKRLDKISENVINWWVKQNRGSNGNSLETIIKKTSGQVSKVANDNDVDPWDEAV